MYHPTRGGVRGGRDQFSWENVKTDKDREYYLGHSVMAPVGRWQQGKDANWYSKDGEAKQKAVQDEFSQAKEMEERALMAALGYRVSKKEPSKATSQPETKPAISQRERERDDSRKISSDKPRTKKDSKGPQSSFYIGSKRELDKMLIGLLNKYGKEEVYAALDGEPGVAKRKSKKDHKKSSNKKHKRKHEDERSDKSEDESASNSSQDSTRKRKHRENKHDSRDYVKKGAHSSKRKSKHDDNESRSSSSSSSESD